MPRMPELLESEFWSDGKRTLYHGDARELCPLLPSASFDAIVTDPPYGEGLVTGDESPEQSAALLRDVLQASLHALKPAAHVAYFWSSRSVHLAIDAGRDVGLEFKRLLYMHVAQGGARPYRGWLPRVQPIVLMRLAGREFPEWRVGPAQMIERAMRAKGWSCTRLAKELGVSDRLVTKWYRIDDEHWSYPSDEQRSALARILGIDVPPGHETVFERSRHDLYEVAGGSAQTSHPCEKPLWVMEDIISRLGQSILDPFCGSGTSLVAARDLCVRCIGIEIDAAHCRKSAGRLVQRDLFSAA